MTPQGTARARGARLWVAIAVVAGVSASSVAHAELEVTGTVFADRDRDGVLSPGDQPLAGVRVAWETRFLAETDARGRYRMRVPGPGIVWAHIPAGYEPHPVWARLGADTAAEVSLGLRPSAAEGPLLFVHASDSHLGNVNAAATRQALERATALAPAPHFLTITGDLTSRTERGEFSALSEALAGIEIPFVPVPGNHDWHDGGPRYRATYGPPMYSFDAGGVRFVVLNFNAPAPRQIAFTRDALADLDEAARRHGPPIAVLTHGPPADALARGLAAQGVDYALTGHMHANQVIDHGGMVELNTEPLVMGGIDYTPAGYRLVTRVGDTLQAAHHTLVRADHVRVVHPRPAGEGCATPGAIDIIAAVELGQPPDAVSIAIDRSAEVPATPGGGWTWAARFDLRAPGDHQARVRVVSQAGREHVLDMDFCVAGEAPAAAVSDWPQLQGGPERSGARDAALSPPLAVAWARTTGGHLRGGSAVVADGRVHVPVIDLGPGTGGGVVTFDARTGEQLWAHRTGVSVHNAPAVWSGQVVFTTADGHLHVIDAATGTPLWRHDLGVGRGAGETWLYAAPAVAHGVAYVGLHERMTAVDLRAREVRWQARRKTLPLITLASSSTDGEVVVSVFGRNTVIAWDARTGQELWQYRNEVNRPIHAAPVIHGDRVYLVDSSTRAVALDLATGTARWKQPLVSGFVQLGEEVVGTPALSAGRLFVPTPRDGLVALDADTGRILWRLAGRDSVIHPFSYLTRARGMAAAPVVTGSVVWAGGSDGVLRAVNARSGRELWSMDLGAPILGGPAPAGELLVVTSYDGTVRALRPAPGATAGCNARTVALLALLALLALTMLARLRQPAPVTPRPERVTG